MNKTNAMEAAMQILHGGLIPRDCKLPTAEQVATVIMDNMVPKSAAPSLTQVSFEDADFPVAKAMAAKMGFSDSTAYTSSSALIGLFCLPTKPGQIEGCVIKTKELGFLFVITKEDLEGSKQDRMGTQ